jgi:hypothetical protein
MLVRLGCALHGFSDALLPIWLTGARSRNKKMGKYAARLSAISRQRTKASWALREAPVS